jgi:hypothetical protein
MSNCHFVAGGSQIALAASRLALRAPALRVATALTGQIDQRSGYRAVGTECRPL